MGIEDAATGLGAREYDQVSGRFLSADPIIDVADPLQMNGYAYANNSPISKSDPTGLCPIDLCGGGEGKGGSTTGEVTKPNLSGAVYQQLPYDHVVPGTKKRQIFPGVYIPAKFKGWQQVRNRFYELWLGTMNTAFYTPSYLEDPDDPNQQATVGHWLWMACKGGNACPDGTAPSFMQTVAAGVFAVGWNGRGGPGAPGKGRSATPGGGRWKLGEDYSKPNKNGLAPPLSTMRKRFWKNEAAEPNAADQYGDANIKRMKRGSAPQRQRPDGSWESMELSHEPIPERDGGMLLTPRWPEDHAIMDPGGYRRLPPGY